GNWTAWTLVPAGACRDTAVARRGCREARVFFVAPAIAEGYRRRFIGGTLMNRFVQVSAAVFVLGFMGACDQKGPLRVDRVEPAEGISGGGDTVTIVGSGFQPGKTQVEVRFGRHKSESVVIASTSKINAVTPGGDKGPVDVVLSFDDG